jgi:hypothetical protein
MTIERLEPLFVGALGHLVVAGGFAAALFWQQAPVMGVHPALKPLKFAVSIAVFLATMGLVLPRLAMPEAVRIVFSWLFLATMVAEMVPIAIQALRGTTSHFNLLGAFDSVMWRTMVSAIVVATLGLIGMALVASLRPMVEANGREMDVLSATAWRAGLWLLLLVPVSGFAMGSRLSHSVGGADGGAGLPFVNWSVRHGDLRVAHFFAMHAVQVLPATAWLLRAMDMRPEARGAILGIATGAIGILCVGTLAQGLAGKPFVRRAPASIGVGADLDR